MDPVGLPDFDNIVPYPYLASLALAVLSHAVLAHNDDQNALGVDVVDIACDGKFAGHNFVVPELMQTKQYYSSGLRSCFVLKCAHDDPLDGLESTDYVPVEFCDHFVRRPSIDGLLPLEVLCESLPLYLAAAAQQIVIDDCKYHDQMFGVGRVVKTSSDVSSVGQEGGSQNRGIH